MTGLAAPPRPPREAPLPLPATEPPETGGAGPAPRASRERLLALDVFRGMTIAGMLLVNNPGTWGAIYPPLEHATWNGWTPTDLIFPFFVFIVGITTHLSLTARRERGADDSALVWQILRRGALIFLFGFALSAFPGWQWGPVSGWGFDTTGIPDPPSFAERFAWRWEHVRILGVLQRIGIAYTCAALLTLRTSLKTQVIIVATLLYGYWFAMTLIPVPGHGIGALMLGVPANTLAAYTDLKILGVNHVWQGSKTFDPEGPLSTIPAIGTAMLGIFAGRWIGGKRPLIERVTGLFGAGAIAMMAGLMWHWSFPINKSIWTSSYVLFTGGMACVAIATCMWLIDLQRVTWWTRPFVIYGMNPMVAFVGSGIMARCIYSIFKVQLDGKPVALEAAIYQTAFASWLEPVNASLLFAVTFVLLWMAILWALYRKGIVFKV
jgi:predicted acyltransferase